MDQIEREIRRFRAAFYVTLQFVNWVRTRGRELRGEGQRFELVLVWGTRRLRIGRLPSSDPYFALELPDGRLERSPYV